jgi:hypothetical protein
MRFALASCLALCLALVVAAPSAHAENWVHIGDSSSGNSMCLDKDSIATRADGLTYWSVKMCNDPSGQWYAVNCTANFKIEFLVRIYDVGSTEKFREMTMDYPDSILAGEADMACHKS